MPPAVVNGTLTTIDGALSTGLKTNLPPVPTPSIPKMGPSGVMRALGTGGKVLGTAAIVLDAAIVFDEAVVGGYVAEKRGKTFSTGFKDRFIPGAASSAATFLTASAAATLVNAVIIVGATALAITPPVLLVTGVIVIGAGIAGYLASSTGFSGRVGNAMHSLFGGPN